MHWHPFLVESGLWQKRKKNSNKVELLVSGAAAAKGGEGKAEDLPRVDSRVYSKGAFCIFIQRYFVAT